MVFRHTFLIAALGLLPSPAQAAGGNALEQARQALANGDRTTAAAAYSEIKPDSSEWPDRLSDTWRWHFLRGSYTEAWRILELSRRTDVALERGDYAWILNLIKSKVCTLSLAGEDKLATYLMRAHIYRFPDRFRSQDYREEVFQSAQDGPIPNHLGAAQRHYLADIPTAKPIAGQGCSRAEGRFNDKTVVAGFELFHLQRWYRDPQHRQQTGFEAVELRILKLAEMFKRADLTSQILTPLSKLDVNGWLAIGEPERYFLWSHLVQAKFVGTPPYQAGTESAQIIEALIPQIPNQAAATWFAMLDESTMSPQRRFELVSHLLTIPDVPHRPYLMLRQAEGYAMRNEVPKALAVIRRLLVQEEGEDDQEVMAAASVLAGDLFAEFGYDEAILGAIQNTVPTSQWGRIFRRQLILDALSGNASGFDMLRRINKSPEHTRSLRLSPQELDTLTAMAHRRQTPFVKALSSLGKNKRIDGSAVTFLADLGANVIQLDHEQLNGVRPYLRAIGQMLADYARLNSYNKTLGELTRLFLGHSDDAYSKGSETARSGTVTVGIVNLSTKSLVPSPFRWAPLTTLPLRDLLLVPTDVQSRNWVIR